MPKKRRKVPVTKGMLARVTDENSGQPSPREARFSARHPPPADDAPVPAETDAPPPAEVDPYEGWDELDFDGKCERTEQNCKPARLAARQAQQEYDEVLAGDPTPLEAAEAKIKLLEAKLDEAEWEKCSADSLLESCCEAWGRAQTKADQLDGLLAYMRAKHIVE